MCKHTHKMEGKIHSCRWGAYILAISPNDPEFILVEDSAGYCLFHSQDLDWKLEQGFAEGFIALILYLLEDTSEERIVLHDFHFVGTDMEFTEREDHSYTERGLYFDSAIIKKEVLIYDAVFHEDISLHRLIFKDDVTIINSTFKQQVHLARCVFNESLEIGQGSKFENQFHAHHYNRFFNNLIFTDCTFTDVFDLENIYCSQALIIEENQFNNRNASFSLIGEFEQGLSIRNNLTPGLFSIEESIFHSDSLIYGIDRHSDFQLRDCRFIGTLILEGDEENLLFSPNSSIEIDPLHFSENGRIVFSWCDLLNLNQEFLSGLKDLEQTEKVIVNPSCKIDRLRLVYEYPYNDVNEWVLEDMYRIITRYFRHLFATNLNVEVVRKTKKRLMQVIYTSRENIDEKLFFERLEKTIHYVFSDEQLPKGQYSVVDLQEMRTSLAQRIAWQFGQGSLTQQTLLEQISHRGQVNINLITNKNEFIMGDKHENKQKSITIFGKTIQTMTNLFKGNKKSKTELLFTDAINEVQQHEGFTEVERESILEMLTELQNKVERGEAVPTFLKDSLLSTTGSMASIVSLLQAVG